MSKKKKRKKSILNEILAEQKALLLQNLYIINAKQCLPIPFYKQPPIWTNPIFTRKS